MDRRDFLKRTAAALLTGLAFNNDAYKAFLWAMKGKIKPGRTINGPSRGANMGVTRQMVFGGCLFTGYAHGRDLVSEPARKAKVSRTRFLAGWQTASSPGLQQLL
jgi:hypothetical protein